MNKEEEYEQLELLPLLPAVAGKDEMNLAEFPFAMLSKRISADRETIKFSDMIEGRDGKLIEREWVVTGSDKFGLPRAGDEELYVALMKLTKDNNFQSRALNFTRYELAKTMGWNLEGKNYLRIEEGLKRLQGVSIYAKNAFWDNEKRSYVTVGFGIIDNFALYDEQPGRKKSLPLSSFSWNEILFKSFQAGFIKNLDVDFYFSLDSSITRRLYRFLDKNGYGKLRFEIGLLKLATLLPIQDEYPSQIRRRLDSAHSELIDRGFLSSVTYEGGRTGLEKVIYKFSKAGKASVSSEDDIPISQQLEERGITKGVARELVSGHPISKIQEQIDIFDWLREKKSPLVLKNPAGFLRKSIEEGYEAPADYLVEQKRKLAEQKEVQKISKKEAEKARLGEIQRQVDEYRDQLKDQEKQLLRQEALDLIESNAEIKKEFVSEAFIRAMEAEIVRKRLGIGL